MLFILYAKPLTSSLLGHYPCPHAFLLSSYPPLLTAPWLVSDEGERGGRGRRVLLMYGVGDSTFQFNQE